MKHDITLNDKKYLYLQITFVILAVIIPLGYVLITNHIWEDFFNRQKVGDLVKVKVVRLTDFGVFTEITPGIEGVVFLSELDERKIENPEEAFSVGQELMAKILKMDQRNKKISLSFRQAQLEMQKLEYQKYMQSQDDRHTLGDIMKDQLKNIGPKKKTKKACFTSFWEI